MANDIPPSDHDVLATLAAAPGGLTPAGLLEALCGLGHTRDNTIVAIQRVFDRGLLELSGGAKLVVAEEYGIAA